MKYEGFQYCISSCYCRVEDEEEAVAYLRKNVNFSGFCRSLFQSRQTRLYLFKSQIEERAGDEGDGGGRK